MQGEVQLFDEVGPQELEMSSNLIQFLYHHLFNSANNIFPGGPDLMLWNPPPALHWIGNNLQFLQVHPLNVRPVLRIEGWNTLSTTV